MLVLANPKGNTEMAIHAVVHPKPSLGIWTAHLASDPDCDFMLNSGCRKVLANLGKIDRVIVESNRPTLGNDTIECLEDMGEKPRRSQAEFIRECVAGGVGVDVYLPGFHTENIPYWEPLFRYGKATKPLLDLYGHYDDLFREPGVSPITDGAGEATWVHEQLIYWQAARGWNTPGIEACCPNANHNLAGFPSFSLGGYAKQVPLYAGHPPAMNSVLIVNSRGQAETPTWRTEGRRVYPSVGYMNPDGTMPNWWQIPAIPPGGIGGVGA